MSHDGHALILSTDDEQTIDGSQQDDEEPLIVTRIQESGWVPTGDAFRPWFLKATAILGTSTWASMPVTAALSWLGLSIPVYTFVALKFIAVAALQKLLIELYKAWARKNRPELLALWKTQAATSRSAGSIKLTVLTIIGVGLRCMDFIEAIDPDMDAMTPGTSQNALTPEQASAYGESWGRMPIAGHVLARVSLPCTLAIGLLVVSCFQVAFFIFCVTHPLNKEEELCFLPHIMDSGNLIQMHALFLKLKIANGGHSDRFFWYFCRLPETFVSIWFTISVIVFTVGSATHEQIAPIMFSLCTSLLGFTKLFGQVPYLAELGFSKMRDILSERRCPSRNEFLFGPIALLFISFHVAGAAAFVARLIGIVGCPSHNFELSRMHCAQPEQ